jgi:lysophospholipase L1-like esterase
MLASAGENPLVVLFGDSITAGIYNPPGGCMEGELCNSNGIGNGATEFSAPDIYLSEKLTSSRRPSTVVNWGYGGTTSGYSEVTGTPNDGVGRIQSILQSSASEFPSAQNIVLIMYGTNDPSQGIPSDATGFNVGIMIDKAIVEGFLPVVATVPPRVNEDVGARNYFIKENAAGKATVVDVNKKITDAESEKGYALLYDGIHPSLEGYDVIAQAWFDDFLEAAITQQAPVILPIISYLLDDEQEL